MVSKKQVGIPVAIITVIAGIAGGSYAFDFSQTTTDDHSTNINSTETSISGDTNIYQDFKDEVIDQVTLAGICLQDVIPEEYRKACEER